MSGMSTSGIPRAPAPQVADSAHQQLPLLAGTLDRVGMSGIEVPVRLHDPATGTQLLASARADAFVDLVQPEVRGIHMSRLYLSLQAQLAEQELSLPLIGRVLAAFLGSHQGLSRRASLNLSFAHLVKRPALVSTNAAWRSYPVWMGGTSDGTTTRFTLGAEVLYASTCPCSSALSRQAQADRLRELPAAAAAADRREIARSWLEEGAEPVAVAHSQRSRATVEVTLDAAEGAPALIELIDLSERALGTPVQAAVKREDEAEFARRMATHLLVGADARRRLTAARPAEARRAAGRCEVERTWKACIRTMRWLRRPRVSREACAPETGPGPGQGSPAASLSSRLHCEVASRE